MTALALRAVRQLWLDCGLDASALSQLELNDGGAMLPSSFAISAAAQASIGTCGLAAAEFWRLRGGELQTVGVDASHAVAEFRSEHYFRVDGALPADPWDKIAGIYRCGDGRWARIHTNFAHHCRGVLDLLGCEYDRDSVAGALATWSAFDFEDAAAERGLVVAALRSFAEWDAHPQGRAVAALPPLTITRIGDASPLPLPPSFRPLQGIRALDLTRIIAGPVAGRALAAHGADVLRITSPNLPTIATLDIDTGRGKRNTGLDLTTAAGREALRALLADAHVFIQGYRPGGLAALGFSPEDTARLRPGIVYVSLSAYGHTGPWAGRRGFDSLTQAASGFNLAEAEAAGSDAPRALPAQALDHGAGYLAALGAIAALHRQRIEGGSWHVQVSLAQTGHWLRGLGRVAGAMDRSLPTLDNVRPWLEERDSGFGRLLAVRHAARMALTPARWDLPSMPLDSHAPGWAG
ncbi:CoA transferase [Chromobacterium violaceum]|uniref:Formyl-coenzyme A transferase n=1 Tax=Chromobacterium violaceum TaxID=536 RepID=A0AAX2M6D5_CHRVL|nr:CoA transferase [Chromobacterium violaceum]OLZ82601.1 carnitine dehydratase [Chromobacterium violaceum]STB64362.1 Formyl-coenzyme A transferase [Chromobacterium violaceum]SUX31859.1 Formyl-coenzyme A transferase [Chromobacterium violaceum]